MRRLSVFLLLAITLLAVTACAKPASTPPKPTGLAVEDIREIRYWRLASSDQTRTATPDEVRLFVEAYNAAKPIPGEYGTTAPVRVTVVLKSGGEIRLDGGGQSYSTRYEGGSSQILEGGALHEFLKGLAALAPVDRVTAATGWSVDSFKHWAIMQDRFDSAAKARGSLTFDLRTPDPSLVPSPTLIYVGRGKKSGRLATVIFGDPAEGFVLNAIRSKTKPDFAADVQRSIDDKASGIYKADAVWQLVTIAGIDAIGIEPGTNDGPRVPARARLRPGVVSWFDHGVHYVLYGTRGPQGTPLKELLAIASSMY